MCVAQLGGLAQRGLGESRPKLPLSHPPNHFQASFSAIDIHRTLPRMTEYAMDTDHVAVIIDPNDITFEIPDVPFAYGGSGEIFLGNHQVEGKVAVKRLRLLATETKDNDDAIRVSSHPVETLTGFQIFRYSQRFYREGHTWRCFKFPYLQPFIGFYYKDDRICLVSPFVENGPLLAFLDRHPNVERALLVSIN